MLDKENLKITIIYDNNPYGRGLTTGWGFSCFIRGMEKNVLFDTGGDGKVLLANMKKLGIDPGGVDIVVLSHVHGDHIGGLEGLLAVNPAVAVYLPGSFPARIKDTLKSAGIRTREVHELTMVCENVYATGEYGVELKEQSLLIQSGRGIIVITGCAHPGIVEILIAAKKLLHADAVLLTIGGLHLQSNSPEELREIVAAFRQLGVKYAGPCHCSGDLVR
ncbi:MAG: MBL fold metallo-hydrolase [Desulfobulbaceae bacterium]|nr:MBL fold metallo-hydrolase [Desulfobulbaceae bacterium]